MCSYVTSEKIPNWTGFNYLIHEKGENEDIQKVIYLPALPKKLDTVLVMLLQPRAKTERLGLAKRDTIVDQTTDTKAVEAQENSTHKDLKGIIGLGVDGFFIVKTFLGIISKRFEDASLKRLLVESTLFSIYNLFIGTRTVQKMSSLFFRELKLITVLLLICDSYIS